MREEIDEFDWNFLFTFGILPQMLKRQRGLNWLDFGSIFLVSDTLSFSRDYLIIIFTANFD